MATYSIEKQKEIFAHGQRIRKRARHFTHAQAVKKRKYERYHRWRKMCFLSYLEYHPEEKAKYLAEEEEKKRIKREKDKLRKRKQRARAKEQYEKYKQQYLNDPEFREKEIKRKREYYFNNKYRIYEKQRKKAYKKKYIAQKLYFQSLNQNNPDQSYTETLLKILTLDAEDSTERKLIKDSFYTELRRMQKQDEKAKLEAEERKLKAKELGISLEEYKTQLAKEEAEKKRIENTKKIIKEFFSDEQLEINLKLERLKKKIPVYSPTASKDTEIIEKEIKTQMSKISFNHGKTFLDPNDSTDFNIILGKVSRIKTWNAIVEKFDPDTMMAVLESMPANERKQVSTNNNATNRALYLCKYLLRTEDNLIL